MSRLLTLLVLLSLLALALPLAPAATAASPLMAGYGEADSTWNVGSCAGQYCDTRDPFTDPLSGDTDPHAHNRLKEASYGIQSRLTTRAIVVDGVDLEGDPKRIALVKTDNYLAQDLLIRRVGQLLEDAGSGVTYDAILHAATHNHSSPYQATLAWGVWVFEDVFDARMFEFAAQAMAEAILEAEADLQPARMSATVVDEDVFKANIAGVRAADDGTPAGYPRDFGDLGVTVMAFNNADTDAPIAAWVNHGQHPEGLDGYNLMTADFLGPFERFVERDMGYPVVFSQGDVGSAEGPYLGWSNAQPLPTGEYRAWAHVGYAQLERGARYLADTVVEALTDINAGEGQVPWSDDALVDFRSVWVPGPVSHPYPSVSNCRTETTAQGQPGAPVVGLPDCGREGAIDAREYGIPFPVQQLIDVAEAEGVPVPDHYDAPGFTAVEENLRLRLQAFRVGEVLMASCACEAQVDLILNLESRTNDVEGDLWLGYDWSTHCTDNGDGTSDCDGQPDRSWNDVPNDLLERMSQQVHNDAAGWNDPANAVAANDDINPATGEPWGNFTHEELPADLGYGLPVGVGHAGDYNGYTVSYREYVAYDHYRKALTSYGAHTADYMNLHLTALARAMNDAGFTAPTEVHQAAAEADEARQAALALATGRAVAAAAGEYEQALADDLGDPEPLAQPDDITRFAATHFTWRGGNTAVDSPVAVVERLVDGTTQDGTWETFADASGEVPVMTDLPDGPGGVAEAHTSGYEWTWTAAFEAFSGRPAGRLVQTPEGTYRFRVTGHTRDGGQTVPYEVVSETFEVSAWDGVEVREVGADASGAAYAVVADSAYPRTYDSPFPVIGDDGREDVCETCTFRPWASTAEIVSVVLAVERADGTVDRYDAVPSGDGRWEAANAGVGTGDVVTVRPGDVRDANGETNG